jgi:hypothetical protein
LPMAQVIWYLLNITLFFGAIGLWCRILYQRPCAWLDDTRDLSLYTPLLMGPIVLAAGPLLDNFAMLQINTLILFLVTIGIYNLQTDRPVAAGCWFGAAAALKAFPVLLIIYLLYRKKGKAVLSMALTGAVLSALPILRYGMAGYLENVRSWIALSLSGGYPLGGLNQSAYAMVGRYMASNPFVLMFTKLPAPPINSLEAMAATWIFRVLLAGWLAILWWFLFRKKYRNTGVEMAFFITLMTVFSPIAWRHYFVLMLPGWMVLTLWWLEKKDVVLKWLVFSSGFLITGLFVLGQTGKAVRGFFNCVLSSFTLGAFVILAGLLYCIWRGYGNEDKSAHPASFKSAA